MKWLQTMYRGRDMNPGVQRWLMPLNEHDKGKAHKVYDCLSRIDSDKNKIYLIRTSIQDDRNNFKNETTNENVSDPEKQNFEEHIPILSTIGNHFKVQNIILSEKATEAI